MTRKEALKIYKAMSTQERAILALKALLDPKKPTIYPYAHYFAEAR